MELSPDQKARVEDLLSTKGLTCPQCDSTALASTGVAYVAWGRTSVQYGCTNPEGEHGPFSLPLAPYEAQRIGLS